MRVTLNRKQLKAALVICKRHAAKQTSMPILQSVLIDAGTDPGRSPFVVATDLEVGVKVDVPEHDYSHEHEAGSVCVHLKSFAALIGKMKGDAVSLEAADGKLAVSSDGARASLPCDSPEEYPTVSHLFDGPSPGGAIALELETVRELTRVCHAMSKDDTRYNLNGVHAENVSGGIRWTATDGHRLAQAAPLVSAGPWPMAPEESSAIIPAAFALEMGKLASPKKPIGDTFRVWYDCKCAAFSFGPVTLAGRLIEGKFPNTAQVIPESHGISVNVDAAELCGVLERVSLVANELNHAVRVTLNGACKVEAKHPDKGEACEEIPADYTGEPLVIGYNAVYLREALESIGADRVTLRLADGQTEVYKKGSVTEKEKVPAAPFSPVRIDAEGASALAIVMPVRL